MFKVGDILVHNIYLTNGATPQFTGKVVNLLYERVYVQWSVYAEGHILDHLISDLKTEYHVARKGTRVKPVKRETNLKG